MTKTWRQNSPPERALWLAGAGVALSLLGDLTLYVVLPTHIEQAGIALSDVGLMLSANRLIRILINGPYGVLIERIPRRRIAVPSLFVGALSSLLYTVPGFWPLLMGRLVWGAAWAGIWLSASTIVLDVSTAQNRGRFVGRLQMWFFAGAGASSLVGGMLTDWLGYASTFRVCAVVTLGAAVMWWLLLPETAPGVQSKIRQRPVIFLRLPNGSTVSERAPLSTAILIYGLNWLVFMGVLGATLPLLLEERVGKTVTVFDTLIPLATFTGALVAGNQVLGVAASPLAGWFSDRTGNRWGLVVLALGLGVVALIVTAEGAGGVVITATLLGAVATSVLQTQVITLVGDYVHENQRGRFLGILNTVGDVGSAAGPLLAYRLLSFLALRGVFWLAGAALAISLPWTMWVARYERHRSTLPAD
jgi:MFS family permease